MPRVVKRNGSKEIRSITKERSFRSKLVWFFAAVALALCAGGLTGVLASYYLNNSRYSIEVSALATYRPPQVTTIYADDGETVLAEFAIEKRIPVKIQDVPDKVTDALLAIEDYRFRDHIGIDPYRIVGAVYKKHHDWHERGCINDHSAACQESVSLQRPDIHTQGQ
jgi:membrane carboxypeptidase/penicillin-binding protein